MSYIYTPRPVSPRAARAQHRSSSSGGHLFRTVVMLVVTAVFFVYLWISFVGSIRVEPGTYVIEPGQTLSTLDMTLDLDVMHTRYALWLRWMVDTRDLQVGSYVLEKSVTLSEFISSTLDNPTNSDRTITLLPGWNLYDMDEYFAAKGLFEPGQFLSSSQEGIEGLQEKYPFLVGVKSLEGFLMPDTYRVRMNATPREIIMVMLDEFQKKIGTEYASLDPKVAYDTLILASIVEREEKNMDEQATVAGVLKKRYLENTPIGADATVCYGYQKTHDTCTPDFIGSVIHEENLYNTRATTGLPPTPISSIKATTWQAALHTQDSPYYYYLHDSTGQIHYGVTLDDHNANKRQYLQ